MKFKEMKYERPDMDEVVKEIAANTEKLKNANETLGESSCTPLFVRFLAHAFP